MPVFCLFPLLLSWILRVRITALLPSANMIELVANWIARVWVCFQRQQSTHAVALTRNGSVFASVLCNLGEYSAHCCQTLPRHRLGTSVWFPINRKMVNTIWFRFDLIRFWKDISVCIVQDIRLVNFYFQGWLRPKNMIFPIFHMKMISHSYVIFRIFLSSYEAKIKRTTSVFCNL